MRQFGPRWVQMRASWGRDGVCLVQLAAAHTQPIWGRCAQLAPENPSWPQLVRPIWTHLELHETS